MREIAGFPSSLGLLKFPAGKKGRALTGEVGDRGCWGLNPNKRHMRMVVPVELGSQTTRDKSPQAQRKQLQTISQSPLPASGKEGRGLINNQDKLAQKRHHKEW